MPDGFVQSEITFYHTSNDCTGPRYLGNNGGTFAYYGQKSAEMVFYTRLASPTAVLMPEELNSYEVVRPGDDPAAVGACTAASMGLQSVGEVVTATDSALAAFTTPFRLK